MALTFGHYFIKFVIQNKGTLSKRGIKSCTQVHGTSGGPSWRGGGVKIMKAFIPISIRCPINRASQAQSLNTMLLKYVTIYSSIVAEPASIFGFLLILWSEIAMPFNASLKLGYMPESLEIDSYSQNTGIYMSFRSTFYIYKYTLVHSGSLFSFQAPSTWRVPLSVKKAERPTTSFQTYHLPLLSCIIIIITT
jgi:hypothetical protein